jgi:hypothetical protein
MPWPPKALVVLGGPVGEGDGDDALLVMNLPGEAAVRGRRGHALDLGAAYAG